MKILLFSTLILLAGKLYSQNHEFGIELGAGQTVIDEHSPIFISPLLQEEGKFRRIGISYTFSDSAGLSLKYGLMFDQRISDGTDFNYLRLPVGVEFVLGSKIQLILGVGIYGSVLLSITDRNTYYKYYADQFKEFQIGGSYNGGIGVQLSNKINLSVQYQKSFDFIRMFEEKRSSPGGIPYSLNIHGFDGFLKLGVKYKVFN
jgi:Outer membrane protein beta-barrel domain